MAGMGILWSVRNGRSGIAASRMDLCRSREPRAQPHRLLEGSGGGDALADNIESGAVRRRREGNFQAGGDRDAALEAPELRRDLTLVMVHAEHSVVLPGERLEEYRIRGERTATADAAARGLGYGGADDLNLLAAEQAVLSSVGIERRHRDPRRSETGASHRAIRERQRLVNALDADLIEGLAQREVRGYSREPKPVDDVHLAERARMTGQAREHLMLVVEVKSSRVKGGFAERCESDALQPSIEREPDGMGQRLSANSPRLGRDRGARDGAEIEIVKVDQRDLWARPIDLLWRPVSEVSDVHPCVAGALLEHPRIANHHQPSSVDHPPIGEDPRANLRPDSGVIAEHQPEHRQAILGRKLQVGLRSVKR